VGTLKLYDATTRHGATSQLDPISNAKSISWLNASHDARREHDADANVIAD
jgi:hypothetical protein